MIFFINNASLIVDILMDPQVFDNYPTSMESKADLILSIEFSSLDTPLQDMHVEGGVSNSQHNVVIVDPQIIGLDIESNQSTLDEYASINNDQ